MSITYTNKTLPQHPEDYKLEVIPNRWSGTDSEVELICNQFTCICPLTSQPDHAKIVIKYIPDEYLIESASLNHHLISYENVEIFHEFAINKICHDIAQAISPIAIEVTGHFEERGGIIINPTARWRK
jgi:7-cyano-7-deazaguanine reductase